MSLFLLLRWLLYSAHCTILRRLEVLPRLALLLPVQTDGADAHVAARAEHPEDGALSSWHSPEMLLRDGDERKTEECDEEAPHFHRNRARIDELCWSP